VRGEVEQHVDVVLVETEVQPGRVEVVQVAELAAAHHVAQGPHGGVVLERVAHHERHPVALGTLLHRQARRDRGGERLLHQDVLPGVHRLRRQRSVGARWGRDHERVDVVEGVVQGPVGVDLREAVAQSRDPLLARVDHGHVIDGVQRAHRPDVFRAPVADPDDPDAQTIRLPHGDHSNPLDGGRAFTHIRSQLPDSWNVSTVTERPEEPRSKMTTVTYAVGSRGVARRRHT